MNIKKNIVSCLGGKLKNILEFIDDCDYEYIQEIRARFDKPLVISYKNKEFFLDGQGVKNENPRFAYKPTMRDINSSIEMISQYSLYAFQEELRNGFVTVEGGHRIGITGKTVTEGGIIKTITNINGFNIRICHEIIGCADSLIDYLFKEDNVLDTLIISPPGCGKTTLLRDITRQISNGVKGKFLGQTVGIIDERSEIAGCYLGASQNDIGIRTDILDCCPKALGMLMLVRSMSPQVIVADEIGKKEDIYAIEEIVNTGVKLICTVHGHGIDDIKNKAGLENLLESGIFKRFVVLGKDKKIGEVKGIYNEKFKELSL